ncbi:MAG: hypothetical protein ACT4QC_21810 [Planctomycetaceae bacterium]
MAKKADYRDQVIGYLKTALHELFQAAMYAQGVTHTEVRRLISTTEKLQERIAKEMASDQVQEREDAKRAAAVMQARKETALANRAKSKKK